MIELVLRIGGLISGFIILYLIWNHREDIYGKHWNQSVQLKIIFPSFIFMIAFPYLFNILLPISEISDNGISLYSSFVMNLFGVYIAILSIALSLLWGGFYIHYLGKTEEKIIFNQGKTFLGFIAYSFYIITISVFLPILDRIYSI